MNGEGDGIMEEGRLFCEGAVEGGDGEKRGESKKKG